MSLPTPESEWYIVYESNWSFIIHLVWAKKLE